MPYVQGIELIQDERDQLELNRTGFVGDFLFKLGHLT